MKYLTQLRSADHALPVLLVFLVTLSLGLCSNNGAFAANQTVTQGIVRISLTSGGQLFKDADIELYQGHESMGFLEYNSQAKVFELSVAPGVYDVLVHPQRDGFPERLVKGLQISAGRATVERIELGVLGTVRVRVLVEGQPSADANVFIRSAEGSDIAYLGWNNSSGYYEGKVVDGVYSIAIEPFDTNTESVTLTEFRVKGKEITEQSVNLRLQKQLQVQVTSGGKSFKNVQVAISKDGKKVADATYDEALERFIARVPEGTYDVVVDPYDASYPQQSVKASPDALAIIEYTGETTLELVVRSTYGASYPNATVTIERNGDVVSTFYWDKKARMYHGKVMAGTYDITITPESYFAVQRLKAVELSGGKISLDVELVKANPGSSVDVGQIISQAELVAMAAKYKQSYYNSIPFLARSTVDEQLKRIESGEEPEREALANEFTSLAVVLGAKAMAKEITMTLGAAAVIAAPQNALVVNNFGALLRLLNATEESVQVLSYGRILDPQSPMILTNLASSIFELGDDDTAETFYKQAIRYAPEFSQAHHGLGSIYLMRGDVQGAIEHFFLAAQQYFTPGMRQDTQKARSGGGTISEQSVRQAGGSSGAEGSGSDSQGSNSPDVKDELLIPRLPDWPTRDALSAGATDIGRWSNDIVQNGLTKPMQMATSLMQSKQAASGMSKAYGGPYSRLVFQIESYGSYMQDRVTEIYDQYLVDVQGPQSAWEKEMEQIGDITAAKMEAAFSGVKNMTGIGVLPAAEAALLKMDDADQIAAKERASATDRYFLAWKPIFRKAYEEVAQLTEEYWIYTESPASRIYDADTAAIVNELRRTAVYSSFLPFATELPMRMISFDVGGVGPILRPAGERLEPPAPEPVQLISLPPPKTDTCPFRDGRSFNVGIGIASVQVDCETVEVKAGAGLQAGMTWNFKHKYVSSLYAGVGASGGAGPAEVGANAGVRASFDPNGEVLDVSTEAGVNGSLGPVSAGADTGNGLVVGLGPLNIPAAQLR